MIPERFKATFFGIVSVLVTFFAITAAKVFEDKREDVRPIIHTLSSKQTAGDTYTTKMRENNLTLWESEKITTTEAAVSAAETTQSAVVTVAFPLDINIASKEELIQIKGIGSVTAEKIVSYRDDYGYFLEMDDLLNVDGIGAKKLSMLKGYLYVDSEIFSEASINSETSAALSSQEITKQVPELKLTETTFTAETEDFEMVTENFITETERESYTYDFDTRYAYKDSVNKKETEDEYYPEFPLELNSASVKDLTYINGIGEALAQRIVEYARTYGFYDINDLLNVKGIGESKLAVLSGYVYVDPSGLPPKYEESETSFEFTSYPDESDLGNTEVSSDIPVIRRVNLNSCSVQDLMQLPGIDEELANKVIELRNKIGYFAKVEEIGFAEGMTISKMAGIIDYIYV